ncbi:MAG: PAS domain-containing protein [Cyanobacteria bacterium P01_G01_bin.49]
MVTVLPYLLNTSSFIPHGMCYLWKPELIKLNVVSNGIISLSYFSIPFILLVITHKRKDIPFNWIFFLFAAFILACGIGHSIDIWTLWHPNYWVSGYIRAVTAIISLASVIALFYLMPKILALPSKKQLEKNNELLAKEIEERKNLEEQLRESEKRWQLVLKGTGDGIFDWNIQTNEAFMSPRLKEMLGYSDEEILNTYESWKKLVHPEDLETVEQALNDHLSHQTSQYAIDYRMLCKNNHYRWILARGMATWDDQGTATRMIGSHQDISQRKETEANLHKFNQKLEEKVKKRTLELEKSNQLKDDLLIRERQAKEAIKIYEDIVNNIPIGLSIWYLEDLGNIMSFRLVEINPKASELLKLDRKKNINKLMVDCLPNALNLPHKCVVETYADVVRQQQTVILDEVYYGDENLEEQAYAVKAFPLPNQGVGISFENITEQKQTEKDLVTSTKKYRHVINNINEVIFQTDSQGHWIFLNPAWHKITRYRILDSLNTSCFDYIFDLDKKREAKQHFDDLISQKIDSFSHEFSCQAKSGEFRWLEMKAQLNIKEYESEILGVSGTLTDITERKQNEALLQTKANELTTLNLLLLTTTAQLEKRNQELDQFAYVTSHDLKAPLRAIANLSQWLEEDLEDKLDEETTYQMQLLRKRVHRLENLINGLLQYSRVGRIETKIQQTNINQLLNDILESLTYPPEFDIEIQENMPTFFTSYLPLQQVFANLISNSIKHHNRPNGKVIIAAKELENTYEFSVRDDGVGIAPEYHEKIFTIFQTLEARDKTENTGVGLSIVKKIVEGQGGKITLESKRGEGSTFRFTWPKSNH